jgi:hypothetical protein
MTIEENFADYDARLKALGVVAKPEDYFKAGYLFGTCSKNPHVTQVIIAFGKYVAGHRPGSELWSPEDQEALDIVMVQSTVNASEDGEQACRVCGCTWNNACSGGCYWVEDDLCSACADREGSAQKDEPAAVIDESDDGKFADLTVEGTFLKRGTKLYTRSQAGKLRGVAEEIRAYFRRADPIDSDEVERLMVKLAAELEAKS